MSRVPFGSLILVALAAVASASCSKSSPAQPSAATAVAAVELLTASIVAPRPLSPGNNASIRNVDQPVTLIVQNAISTKPGLTYTFEVATDAAFVTKVQTKDAVAEGTSGQTGAKLDALLAAKDYYWHARASGGGTTGLFGVVYKFTIGPAITIDAPVPIAPLTGTQTSTRPALRVTNSTRQGPAGAITYKFDVSNTATFAALVTSGVNSEGVNETGFIPTADLAPNTTFFWRATAMDVTNNVSSAPSVVQSFTTKPSVAAQIAAQLGVPLWPGAQPPGTNGQATLGSFWNVEPLVSFDGVTFLNPPIESVRIFDLLDRGFDPQGAIDWMNGNGYRTGAAWYPSVAVIGFQYEYMALINGHWDLILKAGA
jgi:hypothetical protein